MSGWILWITTRYITKKKKILKESNCARGKPGSVPDTRWRNPANITDSVVNNTWYSKGKPVGHTNHITSGQLVVEKSHGMETERQEFQVQREEEETV